MIIILIGSLNAAIIQNEMIFPDYIENPVNFTVKKEQPNHMQFNDEQHLILTSTNMDEADYPKVSKRRLM